MPGFKIEANVIKFKDHDVICDPTCADPEYMNMMADELTPDGDIRQHARDLRNVNNDGTWTIKRHPVIA